MGEAKRKKDKRLAQGQQPPLKHQPGDAGIVRESADAFRTAARPFCAQMARLPREEAMAEARKQKGTMIAAATNLAFAVELYMKALRIVYGLGPRRIHDLGTLYADLPSRLRRSIEAAYEAAPKPNVTRYATSLGISITHKDASLQERATIPPGESDESIRAVLERSSNVFEAFRYLHDEGQPGRVTRRLFEYHYLGAAADALRAHVMQGLEGKLTK